ncbi:MAG: HAD hydrolase-like protein [Anaerolineales bacterium]|nr:HAD hydrolase-like protein [Anaerolineales bacterium]
MPRIQALIFDWGDTLMRVFDYPGAMVDWPRVEMMPGVDKSLESLTGRYLCCVASNAGESDATVMGKALERVDILKFFDKLWTSRELGAVKPDPMFFHAIIKDLCMPPEGCVMIGNDYDKDIRPAKEAGMGTIFLTDSSNDDSPLADVVIHSMEDLVFAINNF